MPYIKQIPVDEATGYVKKHYEQEIKRTGHVWNIIHIMVSLQPLLKPALISTA